MAVLACALRLNLCAQCANLCAKRANLYAQCTAGSNTACVQRPGGVTTVRAALSGGRGAQVFSVEGGRSDNMARRKETIHPLYSGSAYRSMIHVIYDDLWTEVIYQTMDRHRV